MAGRIAAGRGLAITYKMQVQQPTKTFCNFMQKRLAKNTPGAKPTQPRLPGVGMDKLFTLRTVEDTFRIKEYINKNHPKSAVLAGGGFIGLELAENEGAWHGCYNCPAA